MVVNMLLIGIGLSLQQMKRIDVVSGVKQKGSFLKGVVQALSMIATVFSTMRCSVVNLKEPLSFANYCNAFTRFVTVILGNVQTCKGRLNAIVFTDRKLTTEATKRFSRLL